MPSKKQRHSTAAASSKPIDQNLIHSELVQVRSSPIHGHGVYAVARIKAGTRVYEYVGERITHTEADRRFARKPNADGHTFLFVVNRKTVIDGNSKGNDARFINHRCDANCETVTENNRIFIEAIRNIKAGEELGYDYQLTWSETDTPQELALFSCRCGSKRCRGTMLDRQSVEQHLAQERIKRRRAKARAASKQAGAKKAARKTSSRSKQ